MTEYKFLGEFKTKEVTEYKYINGIQLEKCFFVLIKKGYAWIWAISPQNAIDYLVEKELYCSESFEIMILQMVTELMIEDSNELHGVTSYSGGYQPYEFEEISKRIIASITPYFE